MSSSVKKIFTVLIVVVACVIIGAFVLNIAMPNVVTSMVNAIEKQLYNTVGLSFDFNNDGQGGDNADAGNWGAGQTGGEDSDLAAGVEGFN